MVIFLGLIGKENMQIEGFFFYIFTGVFAGATIHYLVAKIGGTVLFGRGWCGYACWTVAILDLLPWKQPKEGRVPYLGLFRYVHFFGSLGLVLYILFVLQSPPELESLRELYWFLIGNLVYYGLGFLLAVVLKDNRAFYCLPTLYYRFPLVKETSIFCIKLAFMLSELEILVFVL
jgi:ferredoxin-type protein NapH